MLISSSAHRFDWFFVCYDCVYHCTAVHGVPPPPPNPNEVIFQYVDLLNRQQSRSKLEFFIFHLTIKRGPNKQSINIGPKPQEAPPRRKFSRSLQVSRTTSRIVMLEGDEGGFPPARAVRGAQLLGWSIYDTNWMAP